MNEIARRAVRHGGSRRLGAEPLEKRFTLAGDVSVFTRDGGLRIVGDSAANDISIVQTAPGEFSIVGNAGESFRLDDVPVTGPLTVSGVTRTIMVRLGRGNDSLAVMGLADTKLAARLMVFAGPGADLVSVSSASIGGQLSVSTGNGDSNADGDTVSLTDVTVAGALIVETGAGDDSIAIDGVTARQTGVNTALGEDVVTIAATHPVTFGELLLSLGFGSDSLTIGAGTLSLSPSRQSRFVGGRGPDTLSGMSNITAGSLDAVTTGGFDTIS